MPLLPFAIGMVLGGVAVYLLKKDKKISSCQRQSFSEWA